MCCQRSLYPCPYIQQHCKDTENTKTEIKRPHIKAQFVLSLSLEDFCSKRTASFFTIMGLQCSFLSHEPETWNSNAEYQKAFSVIKQFEVVNDNAERGIALIKHYSGHLTHDENQLQFLLQLVTDHRLQYPDCKKSTLQKRSKENNQQS